MRLISLLGMLLGFSMAVADVSTYQLTVLSDIHVKQGAQPMDFAPTGYQANNDLDLASFTALMARLKDQSQPYTVSDAILLTGDYVGHGVMARMNMVRQVFAGLKSLQKPLFYTHGNNDSPLGDYQAFESINQQSAYQVLKNLWGGTDGFVPTLNPPAEQCDGPNAPCVISENSHQGYYSAWLMPHLALVSLNTVLFNGDYMTNDQCGAKGELVWLSTQLQSLAQQKASVILSMHVPPGNNLYNGKPHWHQLGLGDSGAFLKRFLQILNQASDAGLNILTVVAGHTHYDETHLIALNNGQVVPVFIIPGLSTSHGNSPGLKVLRFAFDASTQRWRLQHFKSYHMTSPQAVNFTPYGADDRALCGQIPLRQCFKALANDLPRLMAFVEKTYVAGNPHQQLPRYQDPTLLRVGLSG
jgi:predicted phosphodiesterase